MLRLGSVWAVALVAGAVVAEEPAESAKYRLAYRVSPDQVVAFEVDQKTEIRSEYEGTLHTVENTSRFHRHFRVVGVESDGSAELEMVIDRAHMTATSNDGKTVVFKSDDPELQHPQFKNVLESVGKPQARVKVSPAGKTLKVTPLGSANAAVGKNAAGGSPEGYLSPLPEEPVAIGDHWKERFELFPLRDKLPVKIEMLRTYKLTAVKNGKATIEFRTAVLTPVDEPELEIQLMQRETAGKILFDLEQGLVISRESEVDRTVIGTFQGKGSMRAISTYKERMVPAETLADKSEETRTK